MLRVLGKLARIDCTLRTKEAEYAPSWACSTEYLTWLSWARLGERGSLCGSVMTGQSFLLSATADGVSNLRPHVMTWGCILLTKTTVTHPPAKPGALVL
jgi:hypothetical protein